MTTQQDPRIAELEELAREEGLVLPMPADMISFLERQGRVVDLCSGEICTDIIIVTMPSAKAVSHLLSQVEGELVST